MSVVFPDILLNTPGKLFSLTIETYFNVVIYLIREFELFCHGFVFIDKNSCNHVYEVRLHQMFPLR